MKEIKISNGKWRLSFDKSEVITSPPGIIEGSKIVCSLSEFSKKKEEVEANGELIVDAGNTAQKCGLLPSELLQQRDELKEALLEAVKTIRIWHGFMEAHPTEMKAWEYYQQSPEMKKINAAIKSTEQ